MFSQLIGQEKIRHYFTRVIDSGRMPHSYLFHGPEGSGKTAAALELAQILTCHNINKRPCGACVSCAKFRKMEHPDVLLFFPVPGSAKPDEIQQMRVEISREPYRKHELKKNASLHIAMVREIKKRLRVRSYQGHGRVFILLGCETLNMDTANALLKLLEEPPEDVSCIITTNVLDDVLPTIRSRCQLLHLSYLSVETIAKTLLERNDISEEKAQILAHLSGGSYSKALTFIEEDFTDKKEYCYRILEYCTVRPLEDLIALAEEMTSAYNISEIKLLLNLLIALLKYHYEFFVIAEIGEDIQDPHINLPVSITKSDNILIESVIGEIEKSVDLLNKNVYLNLILLILIFKLRKLFNNV